MATSCECQSGQRVLRVRCKGLQQRYPELVELASSCRWRVVPGGPDEHGDDAIELVIGGEGVWDTLGEAINYLRGVLGDERIASLRGRWQAGGEVSTANQNSACPTACCKSVCSASDTPGSIPGSASAREEMPLTEMSPLDTSELVGLLRDRRIETWFQPVFHAGTHALWGHECLMRGRAADGRIIGPGQLLDWARQEHLIFMLDRVCRETHIENAARHLPGDSAILINFLPTAIYEPSFCLRTTRGAARRARLDASRVIFEVVESEQVTDMDHLRRIIDEYRDAGFRAALDDVGSGYAGLTLLAELSPDLIKIDRELVVKARTSKMHRIICNALTQIAHQSGKRCLAEGIETAREYEIMLDIGVDLVQGYYFGKPSPQPALTTDVPAIAPAKAKRAARSQTAA